MILSGFTNLVQEEDFEQADPVLVKPVDLTVMNAHIQNVRLIEERRTAIRALGM